MTRCPGCGVELPPSGRTYDFKFNASAECWSLFEEVLAREFQSPALFGQVHQLTVDAYALQHAGGVHPDKSVCVHLVGLYLTQERGVVPTDVPRLLQRLVRRASWPHLDPPDEPGERSVQYVAASGLDEHCAHVREWAAAVWRAWSAHHGVAREMAGELGGSRQPVAG